MSISAAGTTPNRLYMKRDWQTDNAWFAAYFFGNGDTWVKMTDLGSGIYTCETPQDKAYTSVIFCRMNGSDQTLGWGAKWDQTGDLALSASKDFYKGDNWTTFAPTIAGDAGLLGTNWDPANADNKMTKQDDGTYTLVKAVTLEATTYYFKVTDGTWDWSLGDPNAPNNDKNAELIISEGGEYNVTFTYNPTANTVSAAAEKDEAEEPETPVEPTPDPEPAETETVYFVNAEDWTGTISAYAYSPANAEWPGVAATKETYQIAGHDVYSYTAEKGKYANVIFTNKNGGNKQTADLVWTAGQYYCKTQWYETIADVEAALAGPVEYEYVYLINTNDWAKAHIYTWTPEVDSWPGAAMTKEAEQIAGKDVYSYKVVKGTTFGGLNFNCGGDECKTGDLVWQAGKYYAPSKNEWYADAAAAEAGLAAPTVTTYTVAGSSAPLFGEAWAAAKAENDMTLVEGTKYQLVKTDISLSAGEIKYKVTVNHAWDEAYPAQDAVLNIPEAGKYTVTFTFDSDTKAVNATAELIEAAVVLPTVGVKGAWDGWATTTTLTGDDTSAAATVNIATAGVYEFGLDVDGNFQASGATIDKANNSTVVTTNAGNMKLTANVLGDYIFTWTYETNTLTVTYPAGEEVDLTPKYYIAGTENLTGFNWQVDGLEIKKEGDVYKHTFSEMNAGTYEFKITDGTWEHQWNYSNLAANYVGVEQGKDDNGDYNGNIKIVTEEAKTITVIFDPASNKITLENWAEAVPATVTYVLMGVNGDWTTGIEMDVNPDNDKEYMLTCQAISATDAVKVVKLEDGEQVAWYGSVKDGIEVTVTYDDRGNIQLPEGYYNFYFDSSLEDKQLWIAAATECQTTEVKTIFIEEGLEYSVNGTTVTITGLYNDELFELEISDCDINNLEDQTCPITMLIGEFGANGYVENQNATVAVWFNDNIQVTATGLQDYDNSNVTYNIDITAAPSAEEGLSEINVEVYDAVCTIDEDNMLTMLSTTAGVQVNVYNFDRTVAMAEYDYELYTYDGMASGKTNVAIDGNTVSIYVETMGEDNDGNEIPVIAFVSGELPAAEEEDPTQPQTMDIMVTDLVVENNVVMGTGSNFTFVLTLVDYAGEDGTYVLSDESFVRSGMSLRGYAATGSLTKAVDEYYGTYFRGTIQATVGETPFTFNLTMVSEVAKEENITAPATVTYNEENDVVFLANWNGTPISITLEGFENVAEKQYGELILSIGTGEDEFYAFGEPIAYVNGKEISIEGEFYSYITETTYNVALWGTLPDYTRTVTSGQWGTICLPNASSSFTGATFYEVSSLDPKKGLWLDQLADGTQLVAGKPYIFQATASVIAVTYTGEAATTPQAGTNGLTGTFTDIAAAAGSVLVGNYIIAQNAVHVATASNDLPANRAYINAASVPTTTQAEIPGRRRVCMGENAATGLDQIVAPEGQAVKAIVNGQLIIIRDGVKYNVQGQKL